LHLPTARRPPLVVAAEPPRRGWRIDARVAGAAHVDPWLDRTHEVAAAAARVRCAPGAAPIALRLRVPNPDLSSRADAVRRIAVDVGPRHCCFASPEDAATDAGTAIAADGRSGDLYLVGADAERGVAVDGRVGHGDFAGVRLRGVHIHAGPVSG